MSVVIGTSEERVAAASEPHGKSSGSGDAADAEHAGESPDGAARHPEVDGAEGVADQRLRLVRT